MDRLELVVENLSTTFQTFLSPQSSQQAAPKSSIQATPKAQTRKPALRKSGVSLENPYPDLDPGMVEAALASGIEKSSLEQMQALVSKGLKKNVKLTDPFLGNLADPLSESEGEVPEEEDGSVFAPISSDPVAAALGKLTEIAGVLAEDRKKKPSVSKLEAALDSAHGGHSEVAVGSGKRFAAAWRAFRVILRDAPGDVSALIEK